MTNRRAFGQQLTEAGNAAGHALTALIASGWLLVAICGELLTQLGEHRYQRLSGNPDLEIAHHVSPLVESEDVCPAK